jgi:hypothetical protein
VGAGVWAASITGLTHEWRSGARIAVQSLQRIWRSSSTWSLVALGPRQEGRRCLADWQMAASYLRIRRAACRLLMDRPISQPALLKFAPRRRRLLLILGPKLEAQFPSHNLAAVHSLAATSGVVGHVCTLVNSPRLPRPPRSLFRKTPW